MDDGHRPARFLKLFQPAAAYWDGERATEWAGNRDALAVLEEARKEIEVFRRYSDYFSYCFFVMRRSAA